MAIDTDVTVLFAIKIDIEPYEMFRVLKKKSLFFNYNTSLVAQMIKRVCLQCMRPGFYHWVGKILWRRKWQPTPVFLPGESHGRRSLAGYTVYGGSKSWA